MSGGTAASASVTRVSFTVRPPFWIIRRASPRDEKSSAATSRSTSASRGSLGIEREAARLPMERRKDGRVVDRRAGERGLGRGDRLLRHVGTVDPSREVPSERALGLPPPGRRSDGRIEGEDLLGDRTW